MVQHELFSNTSPAKRAVKEATHASTVRFDGADYKPRRDDERLSGQLLKIFNLMKDGVWRTLEDISKGAEAPPASVSAQLRHLRKKKFGEHTVNRRHLANGLYEYQLVVKL